MEQLKCKYCTGPIASDKCWVSLCRLCILCAKWHDNPSHPFLCPNSEYARKNREGLERFIRENPNAQTS